MKLRKLTIMTSALAMIALSPALAQDQEAPEVDEDALRMQRIQRMMERMDHDGDGVIKESDFVAQAKERQERMLEGVKNRFSELDENDDGNVTEEEFVKNSGMRHGNMEERAKQRFSRLDADGDGTATAEEIAEQHFPRNMRGPRGRRPGGMRNPPEIQ
jgi:hypothetical protein